MRTIGWWVRVGRYDRARLSIIPIRPYLSLVAVSTYTTQYQCPLVFRFCLLAEYTTSISSVYEGMRHKSRVCNAVELQNHYINQINPRAAFISFSKAISPPSPPIALSGCPSIIACLAPNCTPFT